MEKLNAGGGLMEAWVKLVAKNSRAAMVIGCAMIIVAESWVVIALYNDRNRTYDQLLQYKEDCATDKIGIIYDAIQKQEVSNRKNEEKIDGLYDRLTNINIQIRNKKSK